MIFGKCANTNCDLVYTDNNVSECYLKMHHSYPVVVCPRCGTVSWLGADKQKAFVQKVKDDETGYTDDDVYIGDGSGD